MSRKENIPYGLNYLFVIKERSDWGGGGEEGIKGGELYYRLT